MKKFFVAILALLYITTSSGAMLHIHYCMGKRAGWTLGDNNSKTCGKCGMEKSYEKVNGCCKDEHTFIKITTDQKTTQSNFQLVPLIELALPLSSVEMASNESISLKEDNPIRHAPPRRCGVAVYVRNCVFLI